MWPVIITILFGGRLSRETRWAALSVKSGARVAAWTLLWTEMEIVRDGKRDLEGRVTREVRPDGVTAATYTYGASGRLLTVTDSKLQVIAYTYAPDGAVLSTTYTNAQIATPSVSYAYDAQYGRVTTATTDGAGVTTYTYQPVGTLGATHLAMVDGPHDKRHHYI